MNFFYYGENRTQMYSSIILEKIIIEGNVIDVGGLSTIKNL